MKRIEEIKGKRQAHFLAKRQKVARAQERAKDRKEVARDIALIKSPAAGMLKHVENEAEGEEIAEDLEMDTNIDTKVSAKAKKSKKEVVKIIEEPEADQEMVTIWFPLFFIAIK